MRTCKKPRSTSWRQALAAWNKDEELKQERLHPPLLLAGRIPAGWWVAAFANKPTSSEAAGHRCGEKQMLMVVAYDIRDEKRLLRVAKHCEDFGVRIQYSVFECRMDADAFDLFWHGLCGIIDQDEDRIVAYRICLQCARSIHSAGTMVTTEKVVAYVF